MRTLSIVFVLAMAGANVIAQPVKGKTLIGGGLNVGYNTYSVNIVYLPDYTNEYERKGTDIFFIPNLGYAVGERTVLGAGIGIQYSNYHYEDYSIDKYTYIGINLAPTIRYFLTTGAAGIYLQGGIQCYLGVRKENGYDSYLLEEYTEKENISGCGLYLSPVVYYYFSPKIMVSTTIGGIRYFRTVQKDDEDNKEIVTDFYTRLYPSDISFGFTFIL